MKSADVQVLTKSNLQKWLREELQARNYECNGTLAPLSPTINPAVESVIKELNSMYASKSYTLQQLDESTKTRITKLRNLCANAATGKIKEKCKIKLYYYQALRVTFLGDVYHDS